MIYVVYDDVLKKYLVVDDRGFIYGKKDNIEDAYKLLSKVTQPFRG